MASIDHRTKLVQCKVIWYGIAGSGKTASLEYLHESTKTSGAQKLRIDARDPTSAYYDYLPLMLGEIRGYKTKFHLFTVPGRPGYEEARGKLLENVDGIVFTADARKSRQAENLASLKELRHHLTHWGMQLGAIPFVLQCTFGDAADALDTASLSTSLLTGFADSSQVPVFASNPLAGAGVLDATKAIARLILIELRR